MSSDPVTTVPVPHGSLNVVSEGVGRPVVLLHAGICDLRSWDALAPMLALFELDRALQDLDEELRRPSGVPAHALAALSDLLDRR